MNGAIAMGRLKQLQGFGLGDGLEKAFHRVLGLMTYDFRIWHCQHVASAPFVRSPHPNLRVLIRSPVDVKTFYTHCLKIMLLIVHDAVALIDGTELWGSFGMPHEIVFSKIQKSETMAAGSPQTRKLGQFDGGSSVDVEVSPGPLPTALPRKPDCFWWVAGAAELRGQLATPARVQFAVHSRCPRGPALLQLPHPGQHISSS